MTIEKKRRNKEDLGGLMIRTRVICVVLNFHGTFQPMHQVLILFLGLLQSLITSTKQIFKSKAQKHVAISSVKQKSIALQLTDSM